MVRLAEDLPARAQPYTGKEVAKATATVCPAFEIVAQRVPGPLENNGLLVIADGAAHQAVVVGKPSADWTSFDLARAPVRTSVDDKELGAGDFGPMLWEDPLAAVGWLATHPYLAGRGLRAGEFVMTGTCTGLILDITPGQKAVGDFGDFGAVMVRFS
jgi:2-keto-4-pentenoate hydratase